MEKKNKVDPKILEKIMTMDPEDIRSLYTQYNEWSRHLHSEILTIATFGITLSLGSLSIVSNPTTSLWQFVTVGIASVIILIVCHLFVESVKNQQVNFWATIDYIEAHWNIRDKETNMYGPLIINSDQYKASNTAKMRRSLYVLTGLVWVIAIVLKIVGVF